MEVVVLGGGLSGMAAALKLSELGHSVVVVEREATLGGLARSFARNGQHYPLGYHHILENDGPLLACMARLGLAEHVRWGNQQMAFHLDGRAHDLSSVGGFLRYPISLRSKLEIVRVAAEAMFKASGQDLSQVDARSWLLARVGIEAADEFFERLTSIRFGHSSELLSAAYFKRRLAKREAVARLGHMPGLDWTHELVSTLEQRLLAQGVEVVKGAAANELLSSGNRVTGINLADGQRSSGDAFINTMPPEQFLQLLSQGDCDSVAGIEYSALYSLVMTTATPTSHRHYWTNVLRPACSFGAVFRLDLLNPTLAPPGMTLLNFATHLVGTKRDEWWGLSDDEVLGRYLDDHTLAFGIRPEVDWFHLERIRYYTPIYRTGYRNPPVRSAKLENLYFAGNYMTFPDVATTGSALMSGERAAMALHASMGGSPA